MASMNLSDDLGPDDSMELDGGRRIDLSSVRISIPVPLAPGDMARLEALAEARGESVGDTARTLLSQALNDA